METNETLERFLTRRKIEVLDQEERARFEEVFAAFDCALIFQSMDVKEHHEFNWGVDRLTMRTTESDADMRAPFYKTVNRAQSALESLLSTEFRWGGLGPSLIEQIRVVSSELLDYAETKESWGPGGPTVLGKIQELGLSILHRKLKNSLSDHPERWRNLELREYGVFKSPHMNASGLNSATPGRLLANLCAVLKLNLHEAGVDHIVEKDLLNKGQHRLDDD